VPPKKGAGGRSPGGAASGGRGDRRGAAGGDKRNDGRSGVRAVAPRGRGGAAEFVGDKPFMPPGVEQIRVAFSTKEPEKQAPRNNRKRKGKGAAAPGEGRAGGGMEAAAAASKARKDAALLKPGQARPGAIVGAADKAAAMPPKHSPGIRKQ